MTKEQFIRNFELLLIHLNDVTTKFCFNKISNIYKFILEPSQRNKSNHLSVEENEYLKTWNKLENTELSFDEVTNLIYKNGKTPKWADCSIYKSTLNKTIVKIYFSRQFRDEKDVYYLEIGTAPFKAVVNTSSHNIENPNIKFDVNWKANLDKSKMKNLLSQIKKIFRT